MPISKVNHSDELPDIVGAGLILAMYIWNTYWPPNESEVIFKSLYQLGNFIGAALLAYGLRRKSKAACLLNIIWSLIALQSLGRTIL